MQTDTSRRYCETGGEADALGTASCLGKSRTPTRRNSSASVCGAWRWRVAALLRSFSCFSIQRIPSGLWVIAYTVESIAVCAAPPELDREGRRPNGRLRGRGPKERRTAGRFADRRVAVYKGRSLGKQAQNGVYAACCFFLKQKYRNEKIYVYLTVIAVLLLSACSANAPYKRIHVNGEMPGESKQSVETTLVGTTKVENHSIGSDLNRMPVYQTTPRVITANGFQIMIDYFDFQSEIQTLSERDFRKFGSLCGMGV